MRERLGLDVAAVWHRCPSPFAPEQLRVTVEAGVDTRWRARDGSRDLLVGRIVRWCREQPGNCLVFFPSYRYLGACRAPLEALPDRRTWVQPAAGEVPEQEELLTLLAGRRDVLGLCVLGGGYSEGVDLPGEQLRSVVIVGPGLPQLDRDTRLQQAWYAERGRDGFAYACLYPALQRVNQALGRVVRSAEDRGAALLVDPRFLQPAYRDLLAGHWDYEGVPQGDSGGR
jgi:DNA excision repair protein ERCC-2